MITAVNLLTNRRMCGQFLILSWYRKCKVLLSWGSLILLFCTALHFARRMRHIMGEFTLIWHLFDHTNVFINLLQVHVYQSTTVADHCRAFALSDPENASFRGQSNHLHNGTYDRCALLHSVLAHVESAIAVDRENLTYNEKEELSFKVT